MNLALWIAAALLAVVALAGVAPVTVPVTAVCRVLLMVGAMITLLRHHDLRFVALNLICLALAAFIAWGRFGPGSFAA
ncbi:hypothetical protein [Streptomyces sp. NPDC048710]|uniref:hypothetical protein n=1 Tax=Streptomyces sp. NPDC048710 TaxID=3365586 RepID=UPI00372341E5